MAYEQNNLDEMNFAGSGKVLSIALYLIYLFIYFFFLHFVDFYERLNLFWQFAWHRLFPIFSLRFLGRKLARNCQNSRPICVYSAFELGPIDCAGKWSILCHWHCTIFPNYDQNHARFWKSCYYSLSKLFKKGNTKQVQIIYLFIINIARFLL